MIRSHRHGSEWPHHKDSLLALFKGRGLHMHCRIVARLQGGSYLTHLVGAFGALGCVTSRLNLLFPREMGPMPIRFTLDRKTPLGII